jgi:hypothetical protein
MIGKPVGKKPHERHRRRRKDNFKFYLKKYHVRGFGLE